MRGSVNVPGASGPDFAEVKKIAEDAASTADAAKTAAENAESAASNAQEAADKALEAISKMAYTIDAVPSQSGSLAYTGDEQTPVWNSYNPDTLTIGGTTKATAAGTYTATFTPKDDYQWSDGTSDPKEVTWTIGKATVALPTQSGTLTYTGSAQSPTWSGYDATKLSIGGTTSATNAGNHTATFTPTSNYQWSDGTTGAKNAVWTIGRATVSTVPAQSGTLTYTGSTQSPQWSNYDSAKLTLGGTTSGTNAGSFSATFTPTSNYQWSDGSTTAKTVSWSIGKATGSLSLNKTSLTLGDDAATGTITATRSGDGTVTAVSSNTDVATVSVSGTTVTVTAKGNGTATITVKVAEGSNYKAPSDATCSVTVAYANVFGVCWNYGSTSTALSRLTKSNDPNGLVTVNITTEPSPAVGTGSGSSPFDNYAPWSGMDEYNIISNAVSYKKGASGFSRTSNDTMVFIPEYYFKIVDDSSNSKRYFYVCDKAKSGFTKHPGSGKYVGRYNTISGYYSKSGAAPLTNIARATARTNSKAKGSKWSLHDFASWCAVWLLYLVEFADWNSQGKIGLGICGGASLTNCGATDSMAYHTGTVATAKTTAGAVQYRHIENPWGNVWEWIDGANFNNRAAYICTTPANYADDTTTNYTAAGVTLPSSGWIKTLGMSDAFPWAFLPNANGGSETTCIPDYVDSDTGWCVLMVGGGYYNTAGNVGLFDFNAYYSSSSAGSHVGARLLFNP
jgi:hypothetical protein